MSGIGVFVVAYNAAATLAACLDRIPLSFRSRISEVIVSDDASHYETVWRWSRVPPSDRRPAHHPHPQTAISATAAIRRPLPPRHGRHWRSSSCCFTGGQYAPELLPSMVEPLVAGDAGCVARSGCSTKAARPAACRCTSSSQQDSEPRAERGGGHRPVRVAQRISRVPRERPGRAAPRPGVRRLPFDTEILLQLMEAGRGSSRFRFLPTTATRSVTSRSPIPTQCDQGCGALPGHRMGLGRGDTAFASERYEAKHAPDSSHGEVVSELATRRHSRCSTSVAPDGLVAEQLRAQGHTVVGVDVDATDEVRNASNASWPPISTRSPPESRRRGLRVVLAADVVEHLRDPQHLLDDIHEVLADDAIVVVTVPTSRTGTHEPVWPSFGSPTTVAASRPCPSPVFSRDGFPPPSPRERVRRVESRASASRSKSWIGGPECSRWRSRRDGGSIDRAASGVADALRLPMALCHAAPPAPGIESSHRAASFVRPAGDRPGNRGDTLHRTPHPPRSCRAGVVYLQTAPRASRALEQYRASIGVDGQVPNAARLDRERGTGEAGHPGPDRRSEPVSAEVLDRDHIRFAARGLSDRHHGLDATGAGPRTSRRAISNPTASVRSTGVHATGSSATEDDLRSSTGPRSPQPRTAARADPARQEVAPNGPRRIVRLQKRVDDRWNPRKPVS